MQPPSDSTSRSAHLHHVLQLGGVAERRVGSSSRIVDFSSGGGGPDTAAWTEERFQKTVHAAARCRGARAAMPTPRTVGAAHSTPASSPAAAAATAAVRVHVAASSPVVASMAAAAAADVCAHIAVSSPAVSSAATAAVRFRIAARDALYDVR
eukprot:356979-Chlamydomonas_euryale.AAC.4